METINTYENMEFHAESIEKFPDELLAKFLTELPSELPFESLPRNSVGESPDKNTENLFKEFVSAFPEKIEEEIPTMEVEEIPAMEIEEISTEGRAENFVQNFWDNSRDQFPVNCENITVDPIENSEMLQQTLINTIQCAICLRNFQTPTALAVHMRTHTNEKPYKCDICEKRFAQKSNLNIHLRIHTEERLFRCETCFKTFSLKCDWEEHVRTHTEEGPFECALCDKAYNSKIMLKDRVTNHGF